ncbi:MAG: CAP domain-containing protein [bacterium]|nr:CAP domain-containing protein [bacterium]
MQYASDLLLYGTGERAFEFPTFRKFFISAQDHFIPHSRNNYHPHILSHRMLGLLSLLLMTVKIVSVSLIAVSPVMSVDASAITSETVVSLANTSRAENNLPVLRTNGLLAQAAQNKANDMLARQYFSHNTPDGATPWTFIKATGYSYITAGENLAIDFTEAESVQSAWMNSPGHRANILNKSFEEIGIGISKGKFDGHDTVIVVQMFGTPIAQKVTTQSQPTQVAQSTQASAAAAPQEVASAQAAPATAQAIASEIPISEPLAIHETKTALQGDKLYVSVTASSSATKIIALYGNQSVMLDAAGGNLWHGTILVSKISPYDNLVVQAYDINGKITQTPVAQFSESLNQAFASSGNVEGASVKVLGTEINPQLMEEKIFLIAIAILVACLILAIAIKRHVQHVSLIANTSFVAMLAAILMMT